MDAGNAHCRAMAARKYKHVTAARLRELLNYDPDTGVFTWLITRKGRPYGYIPAGTQAGSVWQNGYRFIMLDGQSYPASRLAFLWMLGFAPPQEVDHVNCNRSDNRWSNLRLATHTQNQGNKKPQINNRLGLKGVCYEAKRRKYKAYIDVKGKSVNLGRFDTVEEAQAAYARAAEFYFGKFARV